MTKFERLLAPGHIGMMGLKNRLVMAPMALSQGDEGGYVSNRMIDFYLTRARGGVGLIVTLAASISVDSPGFNNRWLNIYDDRFIPRLNELVRAVQASGARVALQLWHGGPALATYGHPELATGPSPIPVVAYGIQGPPPRVASKEEIKKFITEFSNAAWRVKQAGFDAVELHGASYYLMSAFQSPLTNKRTDDYGGSPMRRARFGCEVIAAIRQRVGPDYPIIQRMNVRDFVKEGGLTIEEAAQQAPLFVEAGANALHMRDGFGVPPGMGFFQGEPGFLVPAAAAIKRAVNVPVIASTMIDASLGEQVLAEGKADFISMARGLLADPDLVNKVRDDRLEDVHVCIDCRECSYRLMGRVEWRTHEKNRIRDYIACVVNAAVGQEVGLEFRATSSPKNVAVVGGGLAGMVAARVLAERGHCVILYERSDRLGGQWNIAARQRLKGKYGALVDSLSSILRRLRVGVVLNQEVTSQFVRENKPDAIVVATGARPTVPDVTGIKRRNVVLANDVFIGQASVGATVAVIGGRIRGLEMAAELAEAGKRVFLITRRDIARDLPRRETWTLMIRLKEAGVQTWPNSPLVEVTDDGITVDREGKTQHILVDTVVLATGVESDKQLVAELERIVPEVYAIGDCVEPRTALDAIYEGLKVGSTL